uniref:Secreted protein n=1 Tax=Ixodes scapularis TaxID=6945 RepID=A0A4D5RCN9_IXOSC
MHHPALNVCFSSKNVITIFILFQVFIAAGYSVECASCRAPMYCFSAMHRCSEGGTLDGTNPSQSTFRKMRIVQFFSKQISNSLLFETSIRKFEYSHKPTFNLFLNPHCLHNILHTQLISILDLSSFQT